ncbi:MAG: ubiquinol-cytochrome C chaperone family protein [bacterium]|nr:ubiquinol-cytochrome C chaperone family protein [bacterium]
MVTWKVLRQLLNRSRFSERAHLLHDAIVAQARKPDLFRCHAIPDTFDGRFEFLVLHVLLVMRRLRTSGTGGDDAAQELFDLVFADFDRALRETGVGDLKVGSRIRRMAQAYFGRARALDDALAAPVPDDLDKVLERNVYGTVTVGPETLSRLASYVRRQVAHFDCMENHRVLTGHIDFAGVEGE